MKTKGKLVRCMPVLICLTLLIMISPSYAAMNDYCLIPPYVARTGVPPNITVVYEKGSTILNRAYSTTYNPSTTYYGFFESNHKYTYDSTNNYFIMNDSCSGNNCFSANILNWALMSSLDLSRKALIGFGWPDPGAGTSAGEVFTYTGSLDSVGQESPDTTVSTGSGYTFCLSEATGSNPTSVRIRLGEYADCGSGTIIVNNKDVKMHFTTESRLGIIQRYVDKDFNCQYDTDVPRFGVRRWNNGNDKQEDIIKDSPALSSSERESYFRSLLTAISKAPPDDPQTPYLGDMMKEIVNYYKGSSSSYSDNDSYSQTPYIWANDPLKACRRTYALFVTTGTYLGQDANKLSPLPSACSSLTYTDAFPTNTCYAYNTDLYTTDGTPPRQNITTYVVHTTFYGSGAANENILKYAANVSDGEYLKVDDPNKFEQVLEQAILDMLKRAASGTAASVLASGEGSGANLLQAVFYPRTPKIPLGMFEKRIEWIGRITNFWYYVDPFFTTSTILEDTISDKILNLSNDMTVKLRYDTTNEYAVGDLYTYGSPTLNSTVRLEILKNLWDAGVQLWNRDVTVAANKRKIYTTTNGTSFLSGNFSADSNNGDSDNSATLRTFFDLSTTDGDLNHDGVVNDDDARILIRYIHGEDFSGYNWLRSRTTAVDLNGNGVTTDTGEAAKVWKLGDVLNSTPRISSWIPLNNYDTVQDDQTYKSFTQTTGSTGYKDRGMVFTGGNDGMLHAFKLGKLELSNSATCTLDTQNKKACLTGSDLGKEMWAFIPKNVLPYLKYLTDTAYCHVYSVDLSPYLFDASTGGNPDDTKTVNSWRTILIGGMRYGGACRSTSCTGLNCVTIPDTTNNNGYSSYFALDVTDQNSPTLLWEFSDPALGFATTGPAVVRIGPDKTKNGKWFVVFGSGPTGPISTSDQQFLGHSDQNLRLFILDLKTGSLERTIDTGINYAFAGSMVNSSIDVNLDYQDDAVYIGYVKKCTTTNNICTSNTWTDGGVVRLLTKSDPTPSNWAWSQVIDGIGPVTSSITKLQSNKYHILWLYFGTGRYYFEQSATVDDETTRRALFGIKEPCFTLTNTLDTACTTPRTFCTTPVSSSTCGDLTNVTDIASVPTESTVNSASFKGWYINLDAPGNYTYLEGGTSVTRNYRTERVITDPLSTTSGLVFFTTYKPYSDVCSYGGKSFIWAVKYSTGGAPGALLKGIALLQVSTGSIEQLNLSSAFTEVGGRKTSAIEGVPPTAQGLAILSTPPPVKRVIHIRER